MSEPRPSSSLVLVVSLALAAGGWGWALTQHFADREGHAARDVAAPAPPERAVALAPKTRPEHAIDAKSLAALMTTQRSADLIARMGAIAAAAKPGEPNPALVEACRETLLDPDAERRSRDFALVLELLRPEDGPAINELFLELQRDGRGYLEYARFAIRWGEVDGKGAVEFFGDPESSMLTMGDAQNYLFGWGMGDHEGAMAWLEDHPVFRDRYGAEVPVLKGWMRVDNAAALVFVLKQAAPSSAEIEAIRLGAIETLYSPAGAEGATAWIANLPDTGIFSHAASWAWNDTSFHYFELPYDTAARVWSKIGGKPWMDFDRFQSFGQRLAGARVNHEGVGGFANALSIEWPVEEAIPAFRRWFKQSPDEVRTWLDSMPPTEWIAEIQETVVDRSDPLRIR